MEKEKVAAGQRIVIGDISLLPLVRTVVACHKGHRGLVGFAAKEVVAVVVISPTGRRAIDIFGEEVPLAEYAAQVPEVAEMLRVR